jgi:hypothetical protein
MVSSTTPVELCVYKAVQLRTTEGYMYLEEKSYT